MSEITIRSGKESNKEIDKLEKAKEESALLLGKIYPELNLEKWSIWQPTNSRAQLSELVIKREVSLSDKSKIFAEVEVTSNSKFGPLTTEDQKVYYALIKLWEESGRTSERTYFSLRRIASMLKKNWGTKVAKSILQSLFRLRFTAFIWRNSYYHQGSQRTLKMLNTFTILSELKVVQREEDGVVNREKGYFRFYDLVTRNLLEGYTKPLLFEPIINFKSEVAQMLYVHLDLLMADKRQYERRTKELFQDLQLRGEAYKYTSKRKQTLENALKELQGVRLTTGVIKSARLVKTKDGKDYKAVFYKIAGPDTLNLPPLNAPELPPAPPVSQIHPEQAGESPEALVGYFYQLFHGVENPQSTSKELSQALILINQHGFTVARQIVEYSRRYARQTRYHPQTFGGILQYEQRAVIEYRHRNQPEINPADQLKACKREEEEHQRKIEARLQTLPPEQYQSLYERFKQELLINFPWLKESPEMLEFRIKREIYWEIEA